MRIFNENLPCQSSTCLEGIKYKLKKLKPLEGNGFVFTIDSPNCDAESIHIPCIALKALYLLITANEEKK
jgi:hypothetical protein